MVSNVSDLADKVVRYAQSYYEGAPEISDQEFDYLVAKLREIDINHPILRTPGFGYSPSLVDNQKVSHNYGMVGSLDVAKNVDDVRSMMDNPEYVVGTLKYDGLTVICYYENGQFVHALTRGNGSEGISTTLKLIDKVPLYIQGFTGAVRGEFYLSTSNWKEFYPDNPHPRNVAAGFINRKSFDKSESTRFDYIVYKIHGSSSVKFSSKSAMLNSLKNWGFNVAPMVKLESSEVTSDVIDKFIEGFSVNNDIPNDGFVFTDERITQDASCLYKYNEIAFKRIGDVCDVEVQSISWNLTRTGKMTPVVNIAPTKLSGAVVTRVAAYNASHILDKGIGRGSIVSVIRSGEVIPVIIDVVKKSENPEIPTICPNCSGELSWSGADLKCSNPSCDNVETSRLWNWLYNCASVDGLSQSIIYKVLETLQIRTIKDIYVKDHDFDLLWEVRGVGQSFMEKISAMFDKLYSPITDEQFLSGLGLPLLGWTNSCKICQTVGIEAVLSGDTESISRIPRISQRTKDSLILNNEMINEIYSMIKKADRIEEDQSQESDQILIHQVAITGAMSIGTRSKFFESLKSFGVIESDIKKANYLITNNPGKNSSKLKYAKDNNIPIISESEFLTKIGYNG